MNKKDWQRLHSADAFIQSDLHHNGGIHLLVHAFLGIKWPWHC